MTKVYVYETGYGNTILLKADEKYPAIAELPPDHVMRHPDPVTPAELVEAAKAANYEVVHWRTEHPNAERKRILPDGREVPDIESASDILRQIRPYDSEEARL